jgi:hypothetical protein
MGNGGVWLIALLVCLSACGADDDDGVAGGAPGGSSGSGTAGASGTPMMGDCAAANTSIGGPALHANAVAAMTPMTASCGASTSCHQGMGKAKLVLLAQTDLRTLMVGKPSCEVPNIPLVDGSGNHAALNHSWLWIKLMHPLDSAGNLMADPAWGTPGNCGQMPAGNFGLRMPWGLPATSMWPDAPKIRDWICAGAPGPT